LAAYNELSAVKTSRKTNSSIPARAEAKVIEAWNVPGFYCRCELRRKLAVLASSVCGLFKWRQFEPEVILLAVGWYLRFSLSYRDVEELLAERGLRRSRHRLEVGPGAMARKWNNVCVGDSNHQRQLVGG
jgi:hypothetical protein